LNNVSVLYCECTLRKLMYGSSAMYWNNCCHPLFHIAMISENGRILDRFQTGVPI